MNWSRYPDPTGTVRTILRTEGGRFAIHGPVSEPGFVGWKLYDGGQHVETHRLQRDAKGAAYALWAADRLREIERELKIIRDPWIRQKIGRERRDIMDELHRLGEEKR